MHSGERWRLGHRPALDGLRGVAVLLVLVGHGLQRFTLGPLAATGVTLFFALSGYLITGILLERPRLHTFYVRRFTRLAPPLFVMVCAVLVVGQIPWTHALGALTWTENYGGIWGDTHPFGVTWSLGVEEQFYLLWPFVLMLIPRRILPAGLAALFVLGTAWRLYLAFFVDGALHSYTSLECASTAMVAGAFVCVRRVDLSVRWGVSAASVIAAMTAVSCVAGGGLWLALPLFVAAPCAVLVGSAESLVGVLGRPSMMWFGVVSYSLYLWHDTLPSVFGLDASPLGIALGTIAGIGAYYAVERPVMRWRRRSVGVERDSVKSGVGVRAGRDDDSAVGVDVDLLIGDRR